MKKMYRIQVISLSTNKAKKKTGQLIKILSLIIAVLPARSLAQAPAISYQTPNTYLVGAYAKALQPKSDNVATYRYNQGFTPTGNRSY